MRQVLSKYQLGMYQQSIGSGKVYVLKYEPSEKGTSAKANMWSQYADGS